MSEELQRDAQNIRLGIRAFGDLCSIIGAIVGDESFENPILQTREGSFLYKLIAPKFGFEQIGEPSDVSRLDASVQAAASASSQRAKLREATFSGSDIERYIDAYRTGKLPYDSPEYEALSRIVKGYGRWFQDDALPPNRPFQEE